MNNTDYTMNQHARKSAQEVQQCTRSVCLCVCNELLLIDSPAKTGVMVWFYIASIRLLGQATLWQSAVLCCLRKQNLGSSLDPALRSLRKSVCLRL